MEPLSTPEQVPLDVRFLALIESLDTSTTPNLRVLDEYFAVGAQLFQQKARKGGEDHEEWYRKAIAFQKLENGSYQKEKWFYCLALHKTFLEDTEHYAQEGKPQLAEASRVKANNWLELASACRRAPGGSTSAPNP